MTTEQLYIDGQLVDLKPDSYITLNIQSNMLRDIEDLVGNKTYSVSLPKTQNNMRILGNVDNVQDTSLTPYKTMSCKYMRNGIVLIEEGTLNILSVDNDGIEICITWGLCDKLANIKQTEAKLTDLKSDLSIVWDTKSTKFVSYQDALMSSVFYPMYNPNTIQDEDTSWQYVNTIGGEKKRMDYDAEDGLIVISGNIGDVVDITPDINYHAAQSVAFSVNGGDGVYLSNVFFVQDTYVYAFLDSSRKIIQCSNKVVNVSSQPQGLNLTVPSNAAFCVFNFAVASPSYYEIVRVYDVGDDYSGGTTAPIANMQHPAIRTSWLLARIEDQYGVSVWYNDDETLQFVKSLTIPIIGMTGTQNQKYGLCRAKYSATKTGDLKLTVSSNTGIVPNVTGLRSGLSISYACKASVDVQATYTIPAPKRYSGTNNHGGGGFSVSVPKLYIKMVVTKASKDTTEYISCAEDDTFSFVTSNDVIDNKITLKIRAWGDIEFAQSDVVSLQLCSQAGEVSGLDLNGTISITANISDNVLPGNDYPIVQNLPDIKIMDYLRTLLVLSGTYPHLDKSGKIILVRYDYLWEHIAQAKDWTRKLIPSRSRNTPKKIQYTIDTWCKVNKYKWKSDDKTIYNYDGELRIDNPTLDSERTIIELPFAASDDDRVPMYQQTSSTAKFGDKEVNNKSYVFKGCEPRLLVLTKNTNDKAVLTFGDALDLQKIIDAKYTNLKNTLNNLKIITEYMHLTDIDLQEFDDSIPVYLSQYGAYFAVQEIKQTSNNYCEVRLLKLNIE